MLSAVGAMLVGAVEEAAKKRLDVQSVKVVSRHVVAVGLGWIPACIQTYRNQDVSRQSLEAAVAIAQIEIVGIRRSLLLIASALDCVETLRVRHIERPQDQRIQYAKHHGVCADCQCQRAYSRDSEAR